MDKLKATRAASAFIALGAASTAQAQDKELTLC